MKKTKRSQRILAFMVVILFITVIGCKGVVEGGIGGGDDDVPMRVVMGGGFSMVGGSAHNYIARLNTDGTEDAAFAIGANDDVNAILVQVDGKVLIGGAFTLVDGNSHVGIARLNADGSEDTGFNLQTNSDLQALVFQPE